MWETASWKNMSRPPAALTKQGAFYAFFRKVYDNSVDNIDLYIVDLVNDRLYLINFNT